MFLFDERLKRFQTTHHRSNLSRYQALKHGQDPKILMITCSDSRILPMQLLQSQPGEVFTIRNAGNIVPARPDAGGESATIEYALTALDIDHIIICGHSHCGAMTGLLKPHAIESMPKVQQWLKHGPNLEGFAETEEEMNFEAKLNQVIEENVKQQIQHLKTHPAYLSLCEKKPVQLHGWVYDFENGSVLAYDQTEDTFSYLIEPQTNTTDMDSSFILKCAGGLICGMLITMALIPFFPGIAALALLSMVAITIGLNLFTSDNNFEHSQAISHAYELGAFVS